MSYTKASTSDVESVVDEEYGGMWFLRDELDTGAVGVTVMELEPGASGREHDHAADDQEEVYVCVDGAVDVACGDETLTLGEDDAVWLSADQTRQLHNWGDERAKLVLVGGPTDE
jgi:mannose-6-phosphate isomerase-like protein (cupin superfamily)